MLSSADGASHLHTLYMIFFFSHSPSADSKAQVHRAVAKDTEKAAEMSQPGKRLGFSLAPTR